MQKIRRDTSSRPLLKKKKKSVNEVKASGLQLSFNVFQQPSTQNTIKTSYIKLQAMDPEIF